jgi:hypothetical protein
MLPKRVTANGQDWYHGKPRAQEVKRNRQLGGFGQ